MCGIIAVVRKDKKDAKRSALKLYDKQKERGQEGFGFLALKKGVLKAYERSETEKEIRDYLAKAECDTLIFHHRNPTSTPNFWECAHPILVSLPNAKHNYYVVHNGIIKNAAKLKEGHDKEKLEYSTLLRGYWLSAEGNVREAESKYNDSESMAIELAKELERETPYGIGSVEGSIAFVALQTDKETGKAKKLFWGRNYASPLRFSEGEDFLVVASEGHGEEAKPHTLYCFDYATKKIAETSFTVGVSVYGYGNNYGYSYDREYYHKGTDKKPNEVGKTADLGLSATKYPLIGVNKDIALEYDLDEWMENERELEEVNESLQKEGLDAEYCAYLLERKATLEVEIEDFNKRHPLV